MLRYVLRTSRDKPRLFAVKNFHGGVEKKQERFT